MLKIKLRKDNPAMDAVPQEAQQFNAPKSKVPKKIAAIILAVVLATALITGGYVYYRANSPTKYATYSYSKFESYRLTSAVQGRGMVFTKPTELKQSSIGDGQVELLHLFYSNELKRVGQTYMAALSLPAEAPITADTLDVLSKSINAESGFPKTHNWVTELVRKPTAKFIKDRSPPGWDVKVDYPKSFTSQNLKSNAWTFDFTAVNNSTSSKVRGRAIYAASSKLDAHYYFLVASTNYNWQHSPKTWQKIFDGLQIDQ